MPGSVLDLVFHKSACFICSKIILSPSVVGRRRRGLYSKFRFCYGYVLGLRGDSPSNSVLQVNQLLYLPFL